MSATLESIVSDSRYHQLDEAGKKAALDKFYDKKIEEGEATELDRFVGQTGISLRERYHSETPRRQPFIQERFDNLRALNELSKTGTEAQRKIGVMNYLNSEKEIAKREAKEQENLVNARNHVLSIIAGDPDEVRRDRKALPAHKEFLSFLAEGVEGWGDYLNITDDKSEMGALRKILWENNPIGMISPWEHRDGKWQVKEGPREKREAQAEAARDELEKLGYKRGQQQDVIEAVRKEIAPFDGKDHVGRINFAGEVKFNPEALLRKSPQELQEEISKLDIPAGAKKRALARVQKEQEAEYEKLVWLLDESKWMEEAEMQGRSESRYEILDEYLDKVQDDNFLNNFRKFLFVSGSKISSAITGMVGGTAGMVGLEGTQKFLGGVTDALNLESELQKISGGWGFGSDIVGIAPDILLGRGAGLLAQQAVKIGRFQKLKNAGKAVKGNPEYDKFLKLQSAAAGIGASAGSAYGAGSRTVDEALKMGYSREEARTYGFRQFLITGLITFAGRKTGEERFATGEAFKKEARDFVGSYLIGDIVGEGVEEFTDEFISGILVQKQMDPSMTNEDIIDGAIHAFFLGNAVGGIINLPQQFGGTGGTVLTNPIEITAADGALEKAKQLLRINNLPETGKATTGVEADVNAGKVALTQEEEGVSEEGAETPASVSLKDINYDEGEGVYWYIDPKTSAVVRLDEGKTTDEIRENASSASIAEYEEASPEASPEGEVPEELPVNQQPGLDTATEETPGMRFPKGLEGEKTRGEKTFERGGKVELKSPYVEVTDNDIAARFDNFENIPDKFWRDLLSKNDIDSLILRDLAIDLESNEALTLEQRREAAKLIIKAEREQLGGGGGGEDEREEEEMVPFSAIAQKPLGDDFRGASYVGRAPIVNLERRAVVFRNVNGTIVPFYLSTGEGGKQEVAAGKWYPFFGIGRGKGWINKGSQDEINDYYGSPALKEAAERLDAEIGDILLPPTKPGARRLLPENIPDAGEEIATRMAIEENLGVRSLDVGDPLALKDNIEAVKARIDRGSPFELVTPPAEEVPVVAEKDTAPPKAPAKKKGSIDIGNGINATVEEIFGEAPKGMKFGAKFKPGELTTKRQRDGNYRVMVGDAKTDRVFVPPSSETGEAGKFVTDTKVKPGDKPINFKSSAVFETKGAADVAPATPSPPKRVSVRKAFNEAGEQTDDGADKRKSALDFKGLQEVETLAGDGDVEFKTNVPGGYQVDPKTGLITLEANPEDAAVWRQNTLVRAAGERAAFRSETKGDNLAKAIGEETLNDFVPKDDRNLSDGDRAKSLLVRALSGDGFARKAIKDALVAKGEEGDQATKEDVAALIKDINESPKGGIAKGKFERGSNSLKAEMQKLPSPINLGSPVISGQEPVLDERRGVFETSKDAFDLISDGRPKKDKVTGRDKVSVESGPEGGADAAPVLGENLAAGSVVEVTDKDGNVQVWVVKSTHSNFDGTQRHDLERIPSSKEAAEAALSGNAEFNSIYRTKGSKARLVALLQRMRQPGMSEKPALLKAIENEIKGIVASMTSDEFVDANVEFVTNETATMPNRDAYVKYTPGPDGSSQTTIYFNLDGIWSRLKTVAEGSPKGNKVVQGWAVDDTASLLSQISFEEIIHYHALQGIDDGELQGVVQDWYELAKEEGNEGAKAQIIRWYKHSQGEVYRGSISDEEAWRRLSSVAEGVEDAEGNEMAEGREAWIALSRQVGHEALAGFVSLLKTGNTALTTEVMSHRFFRNFIRTDLAADIKKGEKRSVDAEDRVKTFRFLKRLSDLATRMIESVKWFIDAHRELKALPPGMTAMVNNLTEILEKGGVQAPDFYRVKQKALDQAADGLDESIKAVDKDRFGLWEEQKNLGSVLKGLRQKLGVPNGNIIGFEPDLFSGEMVLAINPGLLENNALTESEIAQIEESLEAINASKRPAIIARNAVKARDYQFVLERLGAEGITGRFDSLELRKEVAFGGRIIGRNRAEKRAIIERAEERALEQLSLTTGLRGEEVVDVFKSSITFERENARVAAYERISRQAVAHPDSNLEISADQVARKRKWDENREKIRKQWDKGSISERQAIKRLEAIDDEENQVQMDYLGLKRRSDGSYKKVKTALSETPYGKALQAFHASQQEQLRQIKIINEAIPSGNINFRSLLEMFSPDVSYRENSAKGRQLDSALTRIAEKMVTGTFVEGYFGDVVGELGMPEAPQYQDDDFVAPGIINPDLPQWRKDQIMESQRSYQEDLNRYLEGRGKEKLFSKGPQRDHRVVPGTRQGEAVQAVKRDLIAQLRGSSREIEVLGKLQRVAEEMDFALLGGMPPERIRKMGAAKAVEAWKNVNTIEEGTEIIVPVNLGKYVKARIIDRGDFAFDSDPEDLLGDLTVKGAAPNYSGNPLLEEIQNLSDILSSTEEGSEEFEKAKKRLVDPKLLKDLESQGYRIIYSDRLGRNVGITFLEGLPFEVSLDEIQQEKGQREAHEKLGRLVEEGVKGASNMLGLDPEVINREYNQGNISYRPNGDVTRERLKEQARLGAREVTEALAKAHFEEGDVDKSLLETGGFSLVSRAVPSGRFIGEQEVMTTEKFYPDELFNLPIEWPDLPSMEGEQKNYNAAFLELLQSGYIGETLLELGSKLEAMESGSNIQDAAVLNHKNGLTPAGYAYQLVSNPYLSFVLSTKGMPLKVGENPDGSSIIKSVPDILIDAAKEAGDEAAGERIKQLYESTMTGLENATVFADKRQLALRSNDASSFFFQFVHLNRMGRAANAAYRSTRFSLNQDFVFRAVNRESQRAVTGPADVKAMADTVVDLRLAADLADRALTWAEDRRRADDRRAKSATPSELDSLISVLTPDRPHKLLDLFTKWSTRNARMVVTGEGESQFVQRETDDTRETANAEAYEDSADWDIERYLRNEKSEESRMAKLRAIALLELHGYDYDRVRQIQIAFQNRTSVQNGDTVLNYDTEDLDAYIVNSLEEMARDAEEQGIIRAVLPTTTEIPPEPVKPVKPIPEDGMFLTDEDTRAEAKYEEELQEYEKQVAHRDLVIQAAEGQEVMASADRRLREIRDEYGWDEISGAQAIEDKRERNDVGKILDVLLTNHGTEVRPNWRQDEKLLDKLISGDEEGEITERHTASEWTLLTHLASRIPGLRVVQGDVHFDNAKDIPGIAFVASPQEPLILMPYRYPSLVGSEGMRKVTKQLLRYLAEHGGVDIVGAARGILDVMVGWEDGTFQQNIESQVRHEAVAAENTRREKENKIRRQEGRKEIEELQDFSDLDANDKVEASVRARLTFLRAQKQLNDELSSISERSRDNSWMQASHLDYADPRNAQEKRDQLQEVVRPVSLAQQMRQGGRPGGEKATQADIEFAEAQGTPLALRTLEDPGIADPRAQLTEENIELAADVIASFTTSDSLKRVLGILSVGRPVDISEEVRTSPAWQTLGRLIRPDLMTVSDDVNLVAFANQMVEEGKVLADEGTTQDQTMAVLTSSWAQNYLDEIENITGESQDFSKDVDGTPQFTSAAEHASVLIQNHVMPDGQENAEDLLMSVLDGFTPNFAEEPKGLTGIVPKRELTEFEARQVMALFSPEEIQEMAGRQKVALPSESATSIEEIRALTKAKADVIRKEYASLTKVISRGNQLETVNRFGSANGLRSMWGDNQRENHLKKNQLERGKLGIALKLLGGQPGILNLGEMEGGLEKWKETLRRRLEDAGLPTKIHLNQDENGIYHKEVDIVDAAFDSMMSDREFSDRAQENLRERIVTSEAKADRLDRAMAAMKDSRTALEKAKDANDFVRILKGTSLYNVLVPDPEGGRVLEAENVTAKVLNTFYHGDTEKAVFNLARIFIDADIKAEENIRESLDQIPVGPPSQVTREETPGYLEFQSVEIIENEDGTKEKREVGPARKYIITKRTKTGGRQVFVSLEDLVSYDSGAIFNAKKQKITAQVEALQGILKADSVEGMEASIRDRLKRANELRDRDPEAIALRVSAMKDSTAVALWAKDTKRLVDSEFGEGVMGGLEAVREGSHKARNLVHTTTEAQGLFLPEDVRRLESQVGLGENAASWASSVRETVANANSLMDPATLVKRMHNLSIANAVSNIIPELASFDRGRESVSGSGEIVGGGRGDEILAPGSLAVLADPGIEVPEVINGQRLSDIIIEARERFPLGQEGDSQAYFERVAFLQEKLAPHFNSEFQPLLMQLKQAWSGQAEKNRAEAASLNAELRSLAQTQLDDQNRFHPFRQSTITAYKHGSPQEIKLDGDLDQVELTQRVISKLAKIHSNLFFEALKTVDNPDALARLSQANSLADDWVVAREQARKVLEETDGKRYTVSENLLVPADIDQTVEDILVSRGFEPTPEEIEKAKKEGELFSATGVMPDNRNIATSNPDLVDPDVAERDLKEKRAIAEKVFGVMEKSGAWNYSLGEAVGHNVGDDSEARKQRLKAENETAAEAFTDRNVLKDIRTLHQEMYVFVLRANEYLQKHVSDQVFGDDPSVVSAIQELKFQLSDFVENTGGNAKDSSGVDESRVVDPRTATKLMSNYAEAKAFLMAKDHHMTLEMGFVNLNALKSRGALHYNNLLHHDARIRSMFAKDLKAQTVAHGVTHILDFGPTVTNPNSKEEGAEGMGSFGRSGARAMGEQITLYLAKAAKGLSMEEQSVGYMTYAITSYLRQGAGPHTLGDRARHILGMFDTADASLASINNRRQVQFDGMKSLGSSIVEAGRNALTETDHRLLRDQKVYKMLRDVFAPVLEELSKADPDEAQRIIKEGRMFKAAETFKGVDGKKALEYGKKIQNLFGYMQRAYQAQGQLIPKSEMPFEGQTPEAVDPEAPSKGSWVGGNNHILKMPTVPFKWQRAFLSGKDVETTDEDPDFSDMVSMRGASFLKNPSRVSYDSDELKILDVNGLRAPTQTLLDMAYRMNVAPSLAVTQAFTGEMVYAPSQGSDLKLRYVKNRRGALATYFQGKEERGNGSRKDNRTLGARLNDIGLAIGFMNQGIVAKDLQRYNPNNRIQDSIEFVGAMGMGSRLISLKQWWAQSVFGIASYAGLRKGLFRGNRVWNTFLPHAFAHTLGRVPGLTGIAKEATRRRVRINEWIKNNATLIYLRNAEGVELYSDLMDDSSPASRNQAIDLFEEDTLAHGLHNKAQPVLNFMSSLGSKTKRLNRLGLSVSIAKPEKVTIQSIFMAELSILLEEALEEKNSGSGKVKVTVDDILNNAPHIADLISSDIIGQAAVVAVDMLGQSDTSKKATIFDRGEGIGQDLGRGFFATFANHLLSTAANSHAGLMMAARGRDKATRKEGRSLFYANVFQNMAYQAVNMGTLGWVLSGVLKGWGEDDEEERQKVQEWIYGIPQGRDSTVGESARRWALKLAMGGYRPYGYDSNKGRWNDERMKKDWAMLTSRTMGELVPQLPGFFMWAGTTLGGDLKDYTMRNQFIGPIMDQDLSTQWIKRAGITFSDEKGKKGARSEDMGDRFAYSLSKAFANNLSDRSYMFMGLDLIAQPFYYSSNSKYGFSGQADQVREEPLATGAIWSSWLPFIPREIRASMRNYYKDQTDAKIWHASYKGKGSRGGGSWSTKPKIGF